MSVRFSTHKKSLVKRPTCYYYEPFHANTSHSHSISVTFFLKVALCHETYKRCQSPSHAYLSSAKGGDRWRGPRSKEILATREPVTLQRVLCRGRFWWTNRWYLGYKSSDVLFWVTFVDVSDNIIYKSPSVALLSLVRSTCGPLPPHCSGLFLLNHLL